MAGNDVFLFSVPSDASVFDVRLRDPTTSGAAAGDITVTAAQTLADIVNSASVAVIITATAAQTLDAIVSIADVDVVVSLNASQTLADIVSAASVAVTITATASQTLADVVSAVGVAVTISVTSGQTLDGIVNAASVAVVSVAGDVDLGGAGFWDWPRPPRASDEKRSKRWQKRRAQIDQLHALVHGLVKQVPSDVVDAPPIKEAVRVVAKAIETSEVPPDTFDWKQFAADIKAARAQIVRAQKAVGRYIEAVEEEDDDDCFLMACVPGSVMDARPVNKTSTMVPLAYRSGCVDDDEDDEDFFLMS